MPNFGLLRGLNSWENISHVLHSPSSTPYGTSTNYIALKTGRERSSYLASYLVGYRSTALAAPSSYKHRFNISLHCDAYRLLEANTSTVRLRTRLRASVADVYTLRLGSGTSLAAPLARPPHPPGHRQNCDVMGYVRPLIRGSELQSGRDYY